MAATWTKWTPEEDAILDLHYGTLTPKQISAAIYKATGNRRTGAAIHRRVRIIGLTHRTSPEGVAVVDLAKELDVTAGSIHDHCIRHQIPRHGRSLSRWLSYEAAETIRAYYLAKVPDGYVSALEAMRITGMSDRQLWARADKAMLRRVYRRGRPYYHLGDLNKINQQRLVTGSLICLSVDPAIVKQIEHAYTERHDLTRVQIAAMFGVCASTVTDLANRLGWPLRRPKLSKRMRAAS
jgi:hypothetical protein